MTFWVVTGLVLAVLLGGAWWMDRRAKARGARVNGDVGRGVSRAAVRGDVDAHRGADTQGHRTSMGGGW
ncbi:hypothetical protein [Modestobacter roseus]|uniref:Uncharacterized protein n=1 Tax=Modestobacter roseus TaxID=1181884 RepID=A0A562IXY2_9ACTN|nr:hypothetical protein [Modestobacter roseus]MQA32708.1 hypothetical protein [Modestobacter roseus]TWH75700.1 hypothetical protein JD78_04264 [Modestobacter roseus]